MTKPKENKIEDYKPFKGLAAPTIAQQVLIRNFIINTHLQFPEYIALPTPRLFSEKRDSLIPDIIIYTNVVEAYSNNPGKVIIEISTDVSKDKMNLLKAYNKYASIQKNTEELFVFDWINRSWYRYNPIDDTWIIQNFSAFLNIDLNTLIESPTP